MDVVLFRHAQKGLSPFHDPHLTPEGFKQAEMLPTLVAKHQLPTPTDLWISEKIRTQQTFSFIAEDFSLSMVVKPELNLRNEHETGKEFQKRVQSLVEELTLTAQNNTLSKCIFMCTHYDWVEESMALIPSDSDLLGFEFSHWAPAHFVHFRIQNGLWQVIKKGRQNL